MSDLNETNQQQAAQPTGSPNIVAYSPAAITHNYSKLEYCRTSMSALAGCTAGILGLYSIYGFVFYFLMAGILWLFVLLKTGKDFDKYFHSKTQVLTGSLGSGLFTYVLFWTFLYGIVNVY